MSMIIDSMKSYLFSVWKELFKSPLYVKKDLIKINNQEEAIQRKEQVEAILKEHGLNKIRVEFIYDEKKGAEYTFKGKVLATKELLKAYDQAMKKIGDIGLVFFYSQQFKGGELVLDSLYPYGFGKL